MKKICIKFIYLFAVTIIFIVTSCKNDEWDQHYNNADSILSDKSLSEYIKSQPEMEKFYRMLEISGYDSILDDSQTYTVWIPSNEALQNINLSDTNYVKELVSNHISRFSHSTSGVTDKKLYMLSKKFIRFKLIDGNFFFGDSPVLSENIATKNGIIYSISGFQKYEASLWEAIDRIDNIDSFRVFCHSLDRVDDYGNESNLILSLLGDLDLEDSVYTVIYPNNQAWIKAYNQISPYFKMRPEEITSTSTQDYYTKIYMLYNIAFRGRIDPFVLDSVYSTTYNVFLNPGRLFEGATLIPASNGYIYLTDSLKFKATESWNQKIKIEAEQSYYGRSPNYANIYTRSSLGSEFKTSGDNYIIVDPTVSSTLQIVSVTFPIPGTLAAKYKIYCVFVPDKITEKDSNRPYIVNFFLSYINQNGESVKDEKLLQNQENDPSQITKMYVGEITLPFCNPYISNSSITVKLKVANAAKASQTTTKSRVMKIDCVILEPVE